MLLLRCPSRSFTIVGTAPRLGTGSRSRGRNGSTDRAPRSEPGLAHHQLPDAGGGHGRSRAGHPGRPRTPTCRSRSGAAASPSRTDRRRSWTVLDSWLDEHARAKGSRASSVIRRSGDPPRPVADTGAVEGPEPTSSSSSTRRHSARGSRGGRPLRRDDPGHPATRRPHELLTSPDTDRNDEEPPPSPVDLVLVLGERYWFEPVTSSV